MGLLLLRVALGVIAAVVGALYLTADAEMRVGLWIAASLAIASGISLLIGFFTPGSGAVVMLGGVGVALTWLPAPRWGLLHDPSNAWLVVVVAVAIVLLGPGAYSLDARLFGRREIVIRSSPNRRHP